MSNPMSNPVSNPAAALPATVTIKWVPLVDIQPGSNLRIRNARSEAELSNLTESIRARGILSPLLLNQTDNGLECVCGHRRLVAAAAADHYYVPAMVRSMTPDEVVQAQLDENGHREGLDPIDEGRAYTMLAERYGSTVEVAQRVRRSVPYVVGRMRLANLPPSVQDKVSSGEVSLAVAMIIAKQPEVRLEAALRMLEQLPHQACNVEYWRGWANDTNCPKLSTALFDTAASCMQCTKRGGGTFFDEGLDDRCYDDTCWWTLWVAEIERRAEQPGATVLQSDADWYDLDAKAVTVTGFNWYAASRAGLADATIRHALSELGCEVSLGYYFRRHWGEYGSADEIETAFAVGGIGAKPSASPRVDRVTVAPPDVPQELEHGAAAVPAAVPFGIDYQALYRQYDNEDLYDIVSIALSLMDALIHKCTPDTRESICEQLKDVDGFDTEHVNCRIIVLALMLHACTGDPNPIGGQR